MREGNRKSKSASKPPSSIDAASCDGRVAVPRRQRLALLGFTAEAKRRQGDAFSSFSSLRIVSSVIVAFLATEIAETGE
jgi:hypothetical protein